MSGATIDVELIGLTLTGGDIGDGMDGGGGAIRSRENITLTIMNSIVAGNTVDGGNPDLYPGYQHLPWKMLIG